MSAAPTRAPWQRTLGARYDELHALLVRVVHPLSFGVFFLTALAVIGGIAAIALQFLDSDALGMAFGAILGIVLMVVAAFTFVLTIGRAVLGLVLLTGWTIGLVVVDDIDSGLLWAIWLVAAASVVLQVVLLAWVQPRRWRRGLAHLSWPSLVGTIIGAVPVVFGLQLLADGNHDRVLDLTILSFAATAVALAVLTAIHLLVRRHEASIARSFAGSREMSSVAVVDTVGASVPLLASLLPTWSWLAGGPWRGTVDGREFALASGFTTSRSPDVPSVHVTLLALRMRSTGPDLWIRRRDRSHDNVLVESDSARVMSFESIRLDEDFSIRVDAATSELDAYRTFGPQALVLLEAGLAGAQLCRDGDVLSTWMVGGVLGVEELEQMLRTALQFAELLERVDAAHLRDASRA
jgi:hypothetical protein